MGYLHRDCVVVVIRTISDGAQVIGQPLWSSIFLCINHDELHLYGSNVLMNRWMFSYPAWKWQLVYLTNLSRHKDLGIQD